MSLGDAEFTALRQTIGHRGTVRIVLLPFTIVAWGILVAALVLFGTLPEAALASLAVLVAGFEAIRALHVGVERIGRYVQVHYEQGADGPQWETAAMAVGPSLPGGGIDPLFSVLFLSCAAINLLPAWLPEPTSLELAVIGVLHIGFAIRILRARIAAVRQRPLELDAFRNHEMRRLSSKT